MEGATTVEVQDVIRDVNQSELSRNLHISLSHISRVFSGDRMPSAHKLKMLADGMGVPMDDLYKYLAAHTRKRRGTKRRGNK